MSVAYFDSIDWLEACDLYQATQDEFWSSSFDFILDVDPDFARNELQSMYDLPNDWSDFTPRRKHQPDDDCPF